MSIFNSPTPTVAPSTDWRDYYPAWAASGLIPLHYPGEVFTDHTGQQRTATGKEPIHNNWQTLPIQRKAVNESARETFNDIAHEIERKRNIGMVIPDDCVCLDLDDTNAVDAVLRLYPDAPAQLTQGGGVHLFFKTLPGEQFKGTAGKLEIDGIRYDIRSSGRSQVACFPSVGMKGRYHWLRPLPIDHSDLPLRPDALLKYLATAGTVAAVHRQYGPMPVQHTKPEAKVYARIKDIDKALYDRIVKDKPITDQVGGRNNAMVRAVGMVLGQCRDGMDPPTPELPFNILLGCILADTSGDAQNPPPSPAELWSACCRLCDSETAKWAEATAIMAVVSEEIRKLEDVAVQAAHDVAKGIAERLNINPEEVKKQAILYLPNGQHYYVLDEKRGGYCGPVSANGLLQRIVEGCSSLFNSSDIYELSSTGAVSMRPVNFILRDFGKPVTRIDRLAGLDLPVYYKQEEKMVMGVWPLRELTPLFNPQIDEWLKKLGGKDYDALADWLATITTTSRPNSALYLRGPKAIGKSLLVDGVARLWGRKCTRYRDAMSRFNDTFLQNPLVSLDEGLSDTTDSLRFREFISETEHVIETKGQPQFTLRGCARCIVTSNNVDALKIKESLNSDDIDAISSRIMWVSTNDEAAIYLHSLRGRVTTERWVEEDLIARHVLWLVENRKVSADGHENRFLVPGNYHPEKLSMLRMYHHNATIFEVIASYVITAALTPKGQHYTKRIEGFVFTRGTVAVRWKGLAEYWVENSIEFGQPPGSREVGKALQVLSKNQEISYRGLIGPAKYHLIDYELLMDEIEAVASIESIKEIEDFLLDSVDDKPSKR